MAIFISKQMNYKTDNESISVVQDASYTTLQVRRVLSDGEVEEFQLPMNISELDALIRALQEML
jgi:hypothetical protein